MRVLGPIAKKYAIKELVDVIVERLSECFPYRKMDDWDSELKMESEIPPINIKKLDAIAVVNLARLLEAPQLLPLAFYTCVSQNAVHQIVAGCEYPDGTVRLASADLQIYLKGYESLLEENKDILRIFAEFNKEKGLRPSSCISAPRCHVAFDKLLLSALDGVLFLWADPITPMDTWLNGIYETTPQSKPCRHCDRVLREAITICRQRVWDKLGDIFNVHPWPIEDANGVSNGRRRDSTHEQVRDVIYIRSHTHSHLAYNFI